MSNKQHINEAIEQVQALLGDRIETSPAALAQHGRDEFWHHAALPDAVAYPLTTEEVSEIVKTCNALGCPIVPFGTGTSVEGNVQAIHGGISVDVTRMNAVLAVNPDDFDATVQAGVTRKQLNNHIRDTGMFFPVDPGADASIGGMTATRASGTNAVRYGTMKDNVVAIKVVLPDGRIIKTSNRAKKSAAGLNLTQLFVGSEGILGIMTEITVRLHGIPESIAAAVVAFPTIEAAVSSVVETIQAGIPIARVELLDDVQLDAINKYSGFDYPVLPTLFMELNGGPKSVEEQIERTREIMTDHGGGEFRWETQEEKRNALWQARHDAAWAVKALRPGCEMWGTDCCVPLSSLTKCIMDTKKDLENCSFPAPMLGHVGDGNYHLIFLIDPNSEAELKEAEDLNARMIRRALDVGGTCTGEHGIGLGKKHFLVEELGEAVDVMRTIKLALDPNNIMNPGKVLQEPGEQSSILTG
ncbi:MAG: FAD-binding protein [Alphaproteobacteria bacterium]|nr:FAD-binding protein [Alphaproteobacteria bacterium]